MRFEESFLSKIVDNTLVFSNMHNGARTVHVEVM